MALLAIGANSPAARSQRVNELEGVIAAKDAKMNALKNSLSKALTNFEGKGLTVEQRDGKVYVSMENKLLFSSGSWAVGAEGREAVEQLGTVLASGNITARFNFSCRGAETKWWSIRQPLFLVLAPAR